MNTSNQLQVGRPPDVTTTLLDVIDCWLISLVYSAAVGHALALSRRSSMYSSCVYVQLTHCTDTARMHTVGPMRWR